VTGALNPQSPSGDLPSTAALVGVLEGTSRELRALAGMLTQIQALLSQLVEDASRSPASLIGLQELDHVTQSVEGIASFLESLAASAHPRWRVDAASAARSVDMSGLASRLGSAEPGANATTLDLSTGDCDFFYD